MTTSSPAATTITGTDLIGPIVADYQRSIAFYRDQLGLVPSSDGDGGAEFHFPDGTTYGIWQAPPDSGMKPAFTIMFTVADAKAAVDRYRELGAAASDPFESEVCHMSMATDPENNAYILHQRKSKAEHTPRPGSVIRGIDIAGFMVDDAQGAMAYYNGVLGLQPTEVDDQGRGSEYTLADGSTFGVWHGEEGQPKAGFVMFAVDDARSAVAGMRERGVTFVEDVMETPVCFLAPCMDPDGNMIIIHQRKAP